MICQAELAWVSSDTPVQTVRSEVCVSGCPGSISTGTQASSGKSGLPSADARVLCESALQVDKISGSPGAGPSSSPKHQTLTPVARSRSSSEPRALTDGVRSRTSASRRKAVAGKMKVAGRGCIGRVSETANISPHSETNRNLKKKGGGDRQRARMIQ